MCLVELYQPSGCSEKYKDLKVRATPTMTTAYWRYTLVVYTVGIHYTLEVYTGGIHYTLEVYTIHWRYTQ